VCVSVPERRDVRGLIEKNATRFTNRSHIVRYIAPCVLMYIRLLRVIRLAAVVVSHRRMGDNNNKNKG